MHWSIYISAMETIQKQPSVAIPSFMHHVITTDGAKISHHISMHYLAAQLLENTNNLFTVKAYLLSAMIMLVEAEATRNASQSCSSINNRWNIFTMIVAAEVSLIICRFWPQELPQGGRLWNCSSFHLVYSNPKVKTCVVLKSGQKGLLFTCIEQFVICVVWSSPATSSTTSNLKHKSCMISS